MRWRGEFADRPSIEHSKISNQQRGKQTGMREFTWVVSEWEQVTAFLWCFLLFPHKQFQQNRDKKDVEAYAITQRRTSASAGLLIAEKRE